MKKSNYYLLIIAIVIMSLIRFSYVIIRDYKNRTKTHWVIDYGTRLPQYTYAPLYYYKSNKINKKVLRQLNNNRVIQVDEEKGELYNFFLYVTK